MLRTIASGTAIYLIHFPPHCSPFFTQFYQVFPSLMATELCGQGKKASLKQMRAPGKPRASSTGSTEASVQSIEALCSGRYTAASSLCVCVPCISLVSVKVGFYFSPCTGNRLNLDLCCNGDHHRVRTWVFSIGHCLLTHYTAVLYYLLFTRIVCRVLRKPYTSTYNCFCLIYCWLQQNVTSHSWGLMRKTRENC